MQSRFISFEGGEGAGKSTQISRLSDWLNKQGITCVTTREPGGTPDAEKLRNLVVEGEAGRWSAMEEMLIMYAARAQHMRTLIKPALAEGRWVLSDRFADSTFAYQGAAGGVNPEKILELHDLVLDGFQPDLTLVLDVPVETGSSRVSKRGENLTRFETQKTEFARKVRAGFLKLAIENSRRMQVIDGTHSENQVERDIQRAVKAAFFPGGLE